MISEKRIANAVGGKTARACDYCIRKRARWYCAADDAFLCQVCDGSVHSANPLARRHERVRLKTASLKRSVDEITNSSSFPVPSWHRGFTRKARTPRHGKHNTSHQNPLPVVPEVGANDTSSHDDENEDQLLYRVPIFDPFVAQLCTSDEGASGVVNHDFGISKEEEKTAMVLFNHNFGCDMDDLADFAADVETILGKGLEEEAYGIEELGLLDCDCTEKDSMVKVETEEAAVLAGAESDCLREPFELSFDYDSPITTMEEDESNKKRKIMLRLDYEAVSVAWASQGSPWMNGERPQINPDDCWPHCLGGTCGGEAHHHHHHHHQQQGYGDLGGVIGQGGVGDGGREARVSRYREKRRTRLFSKKIRYEVRKLNAEKRPRMKGRFVKRSSFPLLAK